MYSQLSHTRRGSGEPLVLIHGIGHRRQAWDPVFDLLAASYDVIAVDLAGFGESSPPPDGLSYSMEHACENLADNFLLWGIEKPHIVGNSLGGALALELAARGHARSATALSPAGFFRGPDRLVALGLLLALKVTSHLPPALIAGAMRSAACRRAIGRSLYEHGDRLTAEQFLGDTAALRNGPGFFPVLRAGTRYSFGSTVAVPTTVAWGTRDKILLYGQSGLAARRLPQAHHVALPGCGHVPMIDDPGLIVRVVKQTTQRAELGSQIPSAYPALHPPMKTDGEASTTPTAPRP
ncbi:MAG: alpha/beta hydrolase [Aeromicrobium sp.]|uniref:alpha/beta fold hydrolase n=1 Tax=Aeromicrobium sp. TaxID=1871063 RepID=UPI003C33608C